MSLTVFGASRPSSIHSQFATASQVTPLSDFNPNGRDTIENLPTAIWRGRRFVLEEMISRKGSRGRTSWIRKEGLFVQEILADNKPGDVFWICRRCDEDGSLLKPLKSAATTAATDHLKKKHRIEEHNITDSSSSSQANTTPAPFKRPRNKETLHTRSYIQKLEELLLAFLINNDLPFSVFEDPYIREFSYQLEPDAIQDWDINNRIGTVISNNASNNNTYTRSLFHQLDPRMTSIDAEERRMRCYGHILNLVGRAFLYHEDSEAFEQESQLYYMADRLDDDLRHWRKKGPVRKLHNIVTFIRASPQRSEQFKKAAEEINNNGVFTLSDVSSRELELVTNNETRWNSTYLMIERALLKRAHIQAFINDHQFSTNPQMCIHQDDVLSHEDWRILIEIKAILEPLYMQTMRCQGWGKGGSHGRLWEVLAGIEFLLQHLEDWKAIYTSPTDEEIEETESQMQIALSAEPRRSQRTPSNNEDFLTVALRVKENDPYEQWLGKSKAQPLNNISELEKYLDLDLQGVEDPVKWWISQQQAFPTLSKLALDLLAVPAMAADCERAFSLCKLTLSSQRLSMRSSTLEMLQCLKNWLRTGAISLGGGFAIPKRPGSV
ncbi:hypothetical protein PT974_05110 [Cladobotryum mycophilum]|uniref:HAT C-terminal dimerisation domain-containing protein n=1 Tax=Cladobotryum mycophilum TaxID=491253 RepID=A0ABR0S9E5_9HYPO